MKNMKKDSRRRLLAGLLVLCMAVPLAAGLNALSGEQLQQTRAEGSVTMSAALTTDADGNNVDTALSEAGATLSGWDYDTDRYLHVNFAGDTTDKDYRIVVEMAPQLYANISAVPGAPSGFSEVTYTENTPLPANNGNTYIHSYSGTYEYKIASGTNTASLSLQLKYDQAFWNMEAGAELNQSTDPLLKVYLVEVTTDDAGNETKTEVSGCTSSLQQVTAGVESGRVAPVYLYKQGSTNRTQNTISSTSDAYVYARFEGAHDGYYSKLQVDLTLPKCTVDDKTYYLDSEVVFNTADGYITVEPTSVEEGKVTFPLEQVHMSKNKNVTLSVYFFFPEELGSADQKYAFSGGKVSVTGTQCGENTNWALNSAGNESASVNINYEDNPAPVVEDLTQIGAPSVEDDHVNYLFGHHLSNSGGDTGQLTYTLEFDTNDTNAIQVTDINVMGNTGPKEGAEEDGVDYSKIPITYTLVDENGNLLENGKEYILYLDNPYYGTNTMANLNVPLNRSHLPEEQQAYFFKTVSYPIYSIKMDQVLYRNGEPQKVDCAGGIYGYTNTDTEMTVNSKMTLYDVENQKNLKSRTISTVTKASQVATPHYIDQVSVSSHSVMAGEAIILRGRIFVYDNVSSSRQLLNGLRVGILLPKGVEINKASVMAYTSGNPDRQVEVLSVTSGAKQADGSCFWTVIFDKNIEIGWFSEGLNPLAEGNSLNFSMQLNTDSNMVNQTLDFQKILYGGGEGWHMASGAYVGTGREDTYDVNNNGDTADCVCAVRSSTTTEIRALSVALAITDSLRTDGAGSSKVSVTDAGQALTYDLSIRSEAGGDATNFFHFIPIPKADSKTESNFITTNSLKLDMTGPAVITEDMDENPLQIWYTTDDITYAQAAAEEKSSEAGTINWFTELPEGKNWSDVTMIRLKYREEKINNGSRTALSVPLICDIDEEDFIESAGLQSSFHSRGYHSYIRNESIRFEGEASTGGVTAELSYTVDETEITLTAAKDETPTGGGVKSQTLSGLPAFTTAKTYSITSVETQNVELKSSEYIQTNADTLTSTDANKQFAVKVSYGDGTATDILEDSDDIVLGTGEDGVAPTFTFTLHNADALSDITTERYVDIIITGENGVTIPVRINIAREMSQLTAEASSIEAGKRYTLTDTSVKEVSVSRDSAYTAQFVLKDVIPKEVTGRSLVLEKTPAEGTTVLMIDWTKTTAPVYARHVVSGTGSGSEAAYEVSLDQFTLLGGNGSYTPDTTSDTQTKEQIVFVVDHSGCASMEAARANSISLKYTQSGTTMTDKLTYTTTAERSFTVAADPAEVTLGSTFDVDYTSVLGGEGPDSRFAGRRLALVITVAEGEDALPAEAQLEAGGTVYALNTEGRFIVPVGNVQSGNGSATLKLTAASLADEGKGVSLDIELWASATGSGGKPMLGEKVAETAMTQNGPVMPSLRIDDLVSRVMKVSDLTSAIVLKFSKLEVEEATVTLEVQQKVGSGYTTLANKVETVDGEFNHASGVFTIDMSKQDDNMLNLKLAEDLPEGTYRVLMKAKDSNGTELLYVPYNFIIRADETTETTE